MVPDRDLFAAITSAVRLTLRPTPFADEHVVLPSSHETQLGAIGRIPIRRAPPTGTCHRGSVKNVNMKGHQSGRFVERPEMRGFLVAGPGSRALPAPRDRSAELSLQEVHHRPEMTPSSTFT